MATLKEKIRCECEARERVTESGLPDPDRVEYGYGCIRLFWRQSKTVLVIDIDRQEVLAEHGELEAGIADAYDEDEGYEEELD